MGRQAPARPRRHELQLRSGPGLPLRAALGRDGRVGARHEPARRTAVPPDGVAARGGDAMNFARTLRVLLPLLVVLAVVPLALAEAPAARPSVHGLAPLPDDQKVPARLLPPGAFDPDTGPSDVIYPTQQLTLRFNHAK